MARLMGTIIHIIYLQSSTKNAYGHTGILMYTRVSIGIHLHAQGPLSDYLGVHLGVAGGNGVQAGQQYKP